MYFPYTVLNGWVDTTCLSSLSTHLAPTPLSSGILLSPNPGRLIRTLRYIASSFKSCSGKRHFSQVMVLISFQCDPHFILNHCHCIATQNNNREILTQSISNLVALRLQKWLQVCSSLEKSFGLAEVYASRSEFLSIATNKTFTQSCLI